MRTVQYDTFWLSTAAAGATAGSADFTGSTVGMPPFVVERSRSAAFSSYTPPCSVKSSTQSSVTQAARNDETHVLIAVLLQQDEQNLLHAQQQRLAAPRPLGVVHLQQAHQTSL